MQADLLRDKFLAFFKARKHRVVESDSLAPKDDPTALFTPAGMNQFKKEFMGFDAGFNRAVTSQRCLRTDDLEKVGKTAFHHTLFEMLGNFSFGDYFKKEAIQWAWEFLTEELKIKKDKLWVSVYKDDGEAYEIWREIIKIPKERIVKLGDKENFWPSEAKSKGPNGPCGPCSEIFFDFGKDIGCKEPDCGPSCDCGRFAEVWNLVFTQFNRKEGGVLEPLPQKNIDTGMGLERLAAVMQGKKTNFETDLFGPIIKEIADNTPRSPNLKSPDIYAIADHIRAVTFAIYDGVLPSNEDRGYVIRKIIRKSVSHLRALGIKQPFLYKLVPALSAIMKKPYPELDERKENISQIILAEEKNFLVTLNTSDALFNDKFAASKDKQGPESIGKIAFQLYDTYGIPLELTKEWLAKKDIKISDAAFNKELTAQKTRSKLHSSMKGDVFSAKELHLDLKETKFLGYKDYSTQARIIKLLKGSEQVKETHKGEEVKIILDNTVFYAESGGQAGDTGQITKGKNKFQVTDTNNAGKVTLHIGKIIEGDFKTGDIVQASVDKEHRLAIARNHTATHLLQAALRKILGAHVKQQGSLVAAERLRFDFTHFKDLACEELKRIEEEVNRQVLNSLPLQVKQASLAEAKKEGALAFFAEKYGAKVRIVKISDVSLELCGGTHLENTGGIGVFKIIQEGSVASGVRRIEALTGKSAYAKIQEEENLLDGVASFLNVPRERIAPELQVRLSRLKSLEKELAGYKLNIAQNAVDNLIAKAQNVNNIKLITDIIDAADMDFLRKTVDLIKEKVDNAVIALAAQGQDRAILVIGISAGLCSKGIDAGKLIRDIAPIFGGSGGGRKDFAQAGGSKPEKLLEAIEALKSSIANLLSI